MNWKQFSLMDDICRETTVFLNSLLVIQFHAYSLFTKMQEISCWISPYLSLYGSFRKYLSILKSFNVILSTFHPLYSALNTILVWTIISCLGRLTQKYRNIAVKEYLNTSRRASHYSCCKILNHYSAGQRTSIGV